MIINVKDIKKSYTIGTQEVHALRGINLSVEKGEFISIMGPSGSGKTTLMNIIGCLDTPSSGEYELNGSLVSKLEDDELARIRNKEIGFVFQSFNLLAKNSILENVMLPLKYAGFDKSEAVKKSNEVIDKVGLSDRLKHTPAELSGGQQQRVAIARALCMQPRLMLFDEPTSALDPEMIKEVLDTMVSLAKDGMSMICVTHELSFARRVAHRIIFMDEGQIIEDQSPEDFFAQPKSDRAKLFIGQILNH